jgi:hypothetical protein
VTFVRDGDVTSASHHNGFKSMQQEIINMTTHFTRLSRAGAIAALLAILQATAGSTLPAAVGAARSNCGAFAVVPSPTFKRDSVLNAVSGDSHRDVWAVGSDIFKQTSHNVVEHWNGHVWSLAHMDANATGLLPVFPGRGVGLQGVDALSPKDVWAVGQDANQFPMIEHWNGRRWKVVRSPQPGEGGGLSAIGGRSPSDLWAVGDYNPGVTSGEVRTLIEHWNGKRWIRIAAPNSNPHYSALLSIAVLTPTDAWAAGRQGASSFAANHALAEHWNGRKWNAVALRNPDEAGWVISVAALSSKAVWISRLIANFPGASRTRFERWNGVSWSAVSGAPTKATISGMAAAGERLWAVGEIGAAKSARSVAERWNGSRWVSVPIPSPHEITLGAVTLRTAGTVWAVGSVSDPQTGTFHALIERYSSCPGQARGLG